MQKGRKINCNSQTQEPSWRRFKFMHHKHSNHIPTQALELSDKRNG